jgi:hypothetical protein
VGRLRVEYYDGETPIFSWEKRKRLYLAASNFYAVTLFKKNIHEVVEYLMISYSIGTLQVG